MAVNNGNVLQTKSLKSLLNIEGRVGMKAQHSIGFHIKKSFITLYHSIFTITDCWIYDTANLTLFDMGFFEPSVMGAMRAPHYNFLVIAPMIMKFGTGIKLDVFYTTLTKKFVTSLLLRNYDLMTCLLADA